MIVKFKLSVIALSISTLLIPIAVNATEPVATSKANVLTQLIETALSIDASRQQYFAQSQAIRETGVASSTLMDPKLKVGFGGLPVDSFKFDQDPMTNISVGLMQQFERGSTLTLQAKKAEQQADGMALQVRQRELEVANSMTQLWLELGYQQYAQRILRENQSLMSELERFIETNYSLGKSEAQDLLQAQLQVSKLDEKLQANRQIQSRILSQLSEWLGSAWLANQPTLSADNQLPWAQLTEQLTSMTEQNQHFTQLMKHPMIGMAEAAINTSKTQVEIAQTAYQPQFGVEVMYAYRQANDMKGQPASDLVSAYLTMDIPLFTGNRQDRNHAAAQYQVGAAKSQRDVLLAQMNAKVNALLVDKANLEQRLERYHSTLLTQAKARTQAIERGYENSTAQFNDVVSAASDELALQLEQARLTTDLNLTNSNLAYLLSGFDFQVAAPALEQVKK
ncbi:Heavy metal RND efflux outer membrane protein, CzcC family [Vibrio aestuarianus]|uniref:Heavy metal RND efflux outer membrane protein, CzcC family n=1 Tax=Vibrio aestuarianus TaxID=28171 RepID=A0ABM9FIV1_9VIBR|nr:Heavy metal RND efflux outer membrane protein, CzcC family [Vibrio aestuarianus]CAH8225119.1 putative Integral outer membrane protein TolC, efflux pump component [Vibrio aestuarianus subsp. francensis]CAH8222009.1 Heavy metal RND efflux outer membrane protein, CzcC family [Vibrio aestuarianus]CAH8226794.1 Heavy metal RND efflux outer membrane protein, CzcC family [Vibrio aestuarianus]CAH8226795.1 Heavy metal RND efflux outer membrane protein, CzcC family [Vibrio aestuarianus]